MAPGDLELTDAMIERNDVIDNAVYSCILALAEEDEDSLPWDMEIIGGVTDVIKAELAGHGVKVRHPAVVTEVDGRQCYEDYEHWEDGMERLIVIYTDNSSLTVTNKKAGVVRDYYDRHIRGQGAVERTVIQRYPIKAQQPVILVESGRQLI